MKKGTAALVTTALVALAAVMLVVFVLRLSSTHKVKTSVGGNTFDVGPAARLAGRTPLLFPDLRGGDLDVWVQHEGRDPGVGWTTFLAHAPAARRCALRWHADSHTFTDCNKVSYPADGGALPHYATEVDNHGHVVVDFTR